VDVGLPLLGCVLCLVPAVAAHVREKRAGRKEKRRERKEKKRREKEKEEKEKEIFSNIGNFWKK
jgi:ribosomal protein L12E/L44/L45/RPP1/RPP2